MRVDLGCGNSKHPNSFGIDRVPSPETDLVHDFENGIPLPDDSVRFLIACRSLEYVRDLMGVMREIYRVCAHRAIVCITAPYAQNAYHLANPAYRTRFNEFTPFYLTAAADEVRERLDDIELPSDAAIAHEPGIDFRLVRMELFYAPQYTTPFYEDDERRQMVHHQWNVADEIMYHFIVSKKPMTRGELDALARGALEEPARMAIRREQDLVLANPVRTDSEAEEAVAIPEPTALAPEPAPSPPSRRRPRRTAAKRRPAGLAKPVRKMRRRP